MPAPNHDTSDLFTAMYGVAWEKTWEPGLTARVRAGEQTAGPGDVHFRMDGADDGELPGAEDGADDGELPGAEDGAEELHEAEYESAPLMKCIAVDCVHPGLVKKNGVGLCFRHFVLKCSLMLCIQRLLPLLLCHDASLLPYCVNFESMDSLVADILANLQAVPAAA